jgi:hypothetical protein
MLANFPTFYSPYSFTVVLPAIAVSSFAPDIIIGSRLAFYALSALPITVFYLVWSFIFARNLPQISKPSQYLALILVLLSVWHLVAGFKYGLQYQGLAHTLLIYLYAVSFFGALFTLWFKNSQRPSYQTCQWFHIVLFCWLGWVSFPWLGELM